MSRSATAMPRASPKASPASFWVLFGSLFVLWLLWSGHYTVDLTALFHAGEPGGADHEAVNVLLLALGIVSCGGVALLCRRMRIVDDESVPLGHALAIARYLPWLAWQVVLANLDVVRRVLRFGDRDRGETVVVEVTPGSDLGRAIYANSITVTPGTVTVDVTDSTFTVHALTPSSAAGVYAGEMDRRVARLEGSG